MAHPQTAWLTCRILPVRLCRSGENGGLVGGVVASDAKLYNEFNGIAFQVAEVKSYALRDAVQAHRDLETRKTSGSIVLEP
jgi:hypothetical protein